MIRIAVCVMRIAYWVKQTTKTCETKISMKSVVAKVTRRSFSRKILLVGFVLAVCLIVTATHWPALSARCFR